MVHLSLLGYIAHCTQTTKERTVDRVQMASLLVCGIWALVSAFRHVHLITNFAAKITCAEMLLSQQSPLPSLPRLTHDGLIATIDILVSCSDLSKNTRRCLSVKIK